MIFMYMHIHIHRNITVGENVIEYPQGLHLTLKKPLCSSTRKVIVAVVVQFYLWFFQFYLWSFVLYSLSNIQCIK